MTCTYDVVAVGDLNADLILSGDVTPVFGQVEKVIDDATLTMGGSTAIFACQDAISRHLGTHYSVVTIVGNNKVFSDSIQNFSALPHRRVDCVAKVANSVNVQDAMALLRTAVAAIPNVATSPAPDIEILQFTPEGPLLCVRPYTHTDHYWQVYFDTHKAVVATFGAAGYPLPETPIAPRNRQQPPGVVGPPAVLPRPAQCSR